MATGALSMPAPVIPRSLPRASPRWIWALFAAVVVALFVAELAIGPVRIALADVLAAVSGRPTSAPVVEPIVREFRLPRAINALVSGAALGMAGLMLQTAFRNPLADPYVLGIVFGARLGVALLVVSTGLAGNALLFRFGLAGDIGLALASALGSLGVLALLIGLSRRVSTVTLLVAGLMLGYLCTGLISVAMHLIDETQAQAFQSWDDGSFAGATHQQLTIALPWLVAGMLYAWTRAKALNAWLLGERYAASLGVNVEQARRQVFLCLALLVGTVTAFCGPVAFVGLVAAHLARFALQTADHRVLLPAVACIGAIIALAADLVTHAPWATHLLHLNAVNGLLGAPIVLAALLSRARARALDA